MAEENAIMNAYAEYAEIEETDLDELEVILQNQLEETIADFDLLKEEREKIGNTDSLGKTVQDEIWKQFANQIGLELTNETLIQQYNREHPEVYDEVKDEVMQDPRYKEANKKMKEQQEAGQLMDSYTGKDLPQGEKANLDHVVSRKEIDDNQRRRQAGIDTKDLANKKENLKPTNENLNKSKNAKSVKNYLAGQDQREKDLIKQNEKANEKINNDPKLSEAEKKAKIEKNNKSLQNKLAVNKELMLEADKKARSAINKDIAVGVVKNTAGKASKDALKAMAVDALFKLLKEIMNGFIRWIKSAAKTFDGLLKEIKAALTSFFQKLKDVFHVGASSAVGTIVSEIFGPIVSTFKKLASFIKQGISSFMSAIRYLTNKENKDKPLSIKIAQVGKIITGSLVGGSALLLGEVFEKYLLTVPGMQLTIPLLGTLANIVGLFLGSLIAGIIGAMAMNLIDKYIAKRLQAEADKKVIERGNETMALQERLKETEEKKKEAVKKRVASDIIGTHAAFWEYINAKTKENTFSNDDTLAQPVNEPDAKIGDMDSMQIKEGLKENHNDLTNLLNKLERE